MSNFLYQRFRSLKKPFYVFILIVGFLGGIFLYKIPEYKSINLSIDMEVDNGSYIEIYINQDWANPHKMPLHIEQRKIYTFKHIPGLIKSIRIDPTNVAGATVKIYGISFKQADKDLLKIRVSDIAKWNLFNIKKASTSDASLTFSTTTNDPILTTDINYTFAHEILPFLRFLNSTPAFGMFIIISGFLLLVVFGLKNESRFVLFPLLIFLFFQMILKAIADMALSGIGTLPPISNAVGYASFVGHSKSLEIRMILISVFAALIAALISIFIQKKIKRNDYKFKKI